MEDVADRYRRLAARMTADVERVRAQVDVMGDVMRENGVIGAPVEPPEEASDQDRLLCALGRRV